MGGKTKQSQRTKNNVRPSSSGRSAELLNNAARIDPSLGAAGGGKVLPMLFPTLAAPLDPSLNPDFTLCLKKLNKKDPITKTKALQEWCELVKKGDVEDVVAALPSWAHYYRSLTTDTDHKVRETTQVAHGAMVAACGRRIAPHLKQLLPPWLQAQYDEYAPCAAAARAALAATFPESKLPDVISFCKDEVVAHLLEHLVGNAEAALSKKSLTPEEKELQYARLVTASLQGLEFFTQHLPPAHDAWLWAELAPLLQAAGFWQLADSKSQQIRASWYGALGRIIARFSSTFGAAHGPRTARLLLSGAGGAQLWSCLLVLMHHVQDWHTWVDKKDLLIKRIIDVLENGGWGDAKHLSSMVLPLLAYLPEHMLTKEFYESFFNALFLGLEKKAVMSSKSERQAWITSLSECLRYLTVQPKDYVVEVATAAHRSWLRRVLRGARTAPAARALLKHSAASMAALARYWLEQAERPGGDKYDQLVRNFWQNVGSTVVAQIDRLSAERSEIDDLIEAHVLLLQSLKTSFAQDAKRVRSIKFTDELPAESEASGEPVRRCAASVADRYRHNLDEVVEKITVQYFEFALKKRVANAVFASLLTLLIEFDSENLFEALARHFDADSVLGLYDKVLRGWLAGDTMRCKGVAEVVFLLMRHLPENEQEAVLDSFEQLPPPAVEWCISLALAHPARSRRAARRWLRGAAAEAGLLGAARRVLGDGDAASRSLLLLALAADERGEMMISPPTAAKIIALVSAALSPERLRGAAPDALERLVGAAAALASELSGAADCTELALALFRLQLQIPRGAGLPGEAWCELRGAWQDAGAASAAFRSGAVRAVRERLLEQADELDIPGIEHAVSLCPYLLPQFGESQRPAAALAAPLAEQLAEELAAPRAAVLAAALQQDCLRGRLNCPLADDDDSIRTVVERAARSDAEELTRADALPFARELVFRASFLRTLALHRDEEEAAWAERLFAERWFVDAFAGLLHDHAVLGSLRDGYAYWPHYDVLGRAARHVAGALRAVAAELPAGAAAAARAELRARAAAAGYYWSYARAQLDDVLRAAPAEPEDEDAELEDVVTGNGFFHTLQACARASRAPGAALRSAHLVMLRSFWLAHAQRPDVLGAQFLRDAARCRADRNPDPIIDAYYRHQHTMLDDRDVSTAEWVQVVSDAAVVDYLTVMVDEAGWQAPAARWDFATITLCSLAAALHSSADHWGTTKVALLARPVFALFLAVQRFVDSIKSECLKREPSPHVAELPTEWNDIFAPDLHYNLFSIVVKVLASAERPMTAARAAFLSGLLPVTRRLDWRALAPAQRAGALSLPALLGAAAAALAAPAHHGYKYLAHALLEALAKPLVLLDAETLAAWSDDGGEDDEAPRPRLALAGLQPALTALQDLVDAALHSLKLGEETCEMLPHTDSHSVALGYLLLADAAFGTCQLARGDLVHHYLELFREPRHAELLIASALRLLPAGVAACARDSAAPPPQHAELFLAAVEPSLDEPSSSADVARLACRGLQWAARWAGGAARGWWGAAAPRAARALERLLRAYVAPALVRAQLRAVAAAAAGLRDAEVTVQQSTGEVQVSYRVEERALQLSVTLSAAHPLLPPRVAAAGAPGVSTHWLAVYLAYQNGTVLGAIRMWMDAVARRVEAAPQCYICYCRLHPATGRLPRVPCHQCRNKFHAHCLRKWFTSSSKSNCPLCRAVF